MKTLVVLGLVALVVTVSAFPEDFETQLSEEIKKQEQLLDTKGKNISELASEFVDETKKLGQEVVSFFRNAVVGNNTHHRQRRSVSSEETLDIQALLQSIAALSQTSDRDARAEEHQQAFAQPAADPNAAAAPAPAAPSAVTTNEIPTSFDKSAAPQPNYAPPSNSYAAPTPAPAYAPPAPSSYKPAPSSYEEKKKKAVVIAPAPILVPIPGPPGLPGPPGVPGLPGLPGKTPSLRGLKAILLAKVAKLWLLAKAVAVLCFGWFGGNLGLILGLVLPLYAKLKKAGVVLPVHESYDAPAPSYGAPAPYEQVAAAVDYGKSAYEAPAPSSNYAAPPHRRRRFVR